MLNAHIPAVKQQAFIGLFVFVAGLWLAWEAGDQIVAGNLNTLEYAGLGVLASTAALVIVRSWRTGFYLFLIWLLFEDLPRKFMGNGLALFFGKDILAALTYVSLYIAIQKGREKTFRPPFLLPLALFVWLGAIQIFNSNSPSVFYGLLGFKIYFFYLPLIWVGYALIRNDQDLRWFLVVNALAASVIGGIGIIQGIVGNSFLNPTVLSPEIARLGNLEKVSPISGQSFNLPVSVFVSTGRFANYLEVAGPLLLGGVAYLLLHRLRGRNIVFTAIGIIGGAALLSGARGCVVTLTWMTLVMALGFMWGAPWRWRQTHRTLKAIRRSFVVAALGLAAIMLIFPKQAGSRLAFYTETLLPGSSAYEGTSRGWDYPLYNLELAFTAPNWVLGNGIGTASLGRQYVTAILKQPDPGLWMEEGFGVLIVELGIIAPFLWLVWSGVLIYCSWKVVNRLRQTRLFPVGLSILLYVFVLLIPFTWGGLSVFQNYINNAYLWLLTGVLFRLPDLLAASPHPAEDAPRLNRRRNFLF